MAIKGGLFVDGGTISGNPSSYGTTFAWYFVTPDDEVKCLGSGYYYAPHGTTVGNNVAEYYAALQGLKILPAGYEGYLFSDSKITLGRLFYGYACNGIPQEWQDNVARLLTFIGPGLKHCLLDGHPTKAQLKVGIGPRGAPVSPYNVLCDKECKRLAAAFMKELGDDDNEKAKDFEDIQAGLLELPE